jgi:RNA polymerase Rpb2, domain 6
MLPQDIHAFRPSGDVFIVVERSGSPVNGDKFTTLHGQKGNVTIVEDNMMPSVNGTVADIVISSGSIVKRGTASQIAEAVPDACRIKGYRLVTSGTRGLVNGTVADIVISSGSIVKSCMARDVLVII